MLLLENYKLQRWPYTGRCISLNRFVKADWKRTFLLIEFMKYLYSGRWTIMLLGVLALDLFPVFVFNVADTDHCCIDKNMKLFFLPVRFYIDLFLIAEEKSDQWQKRNNILLKHNKTDVTEGIETTRRTMQYARVGVCFCSVISSVLRILLSLFYWNRRKFKLVRSRR